jgi:GntR family transcriptional repressor for pyruvate dehydrogenase complex
MFNAVSKSNATQQIIQQIRNAIFEGELKPGDRLASETQLAEKFSVSKSTLREALRALEHLGLIEMRKGASGGAFVVEVDMEITRSCLMNFLNFRNISIHQISEIRKNLEPYAASVAAKRISTEDLEKLKDSLNLCKDVLSNGDLTSLTKNEIKFHRIITNATRNPILILILDFVENLLEDAKKILKPNIDFSREVVKSHERIYEAIRNRDPETAAAEMLKDVSKVEDALMKLSHEKNNPKLS